MDFGRLRANVSFPFITHVRLTSGRCRTQTTLDSQAKPEVSGTSCGIAIRGRSHPPLIRRFSFDSIAQKGRGSPQYGQSAGASYVTRFKTAKHKRAADCDDFDSDEQHHHSGSH